MLGLLKKLFASKPESTEVKVESVSAVASVPPTSTVEIAPVEKTAEKKPAKKAPKKSK